MKSLPVASRNSDIVRGIPAMAIAPSHFDLPDLTPWEQFKDRGRQLMFPFVVIAIVASVYCAAMARSGEDLIRSNSVVPPILSLKQMAGQQIADVPTN